MPDLIITDALVERCAQAADDARCIAIEREADYLPLIVSRLDKPIQITLDFGEPA